MPTQVIVLNGGSSSGKSGIACCLQAVLPDPWLTFGVDTLIAAMPAAMRSCGAGIEFGPQGEITTGEAFKALDEAWAQGIGAMAHAGARIIVDEAPSTAGPTTVGAAAISPPVSWPRGAARHSPSAMSMTW